MLDMTRVDDSSHLLKPRAADQVAAGQQPIGTEEPSHPQRQMIHRQLALENSWKKYTKLLEYCSEAGGNPIAIIKQVLRWHYDTQKFFAVLIPACNSACYFDLQ